MPKPQSKLDRSGPQTPLAFAALDQELWLAKRASELISAAFTGDTDRELRKARMRRAITAGGIELSVAGRGPSGKSETMGELFARVYGEKL